MGDEVGGTVLLHWLEPPAGKVRMRSAVSELLRETLGVADGRFDEHATLAAKPTAEAALALSQRMAGPEGGRALLPLMRCWVWVAASMGVPEAMRRLAREIADEAVSPDPALRPDELMPMVGQWLRLADGGTMRPQAGFSVEAGRIRRKPTMVDPADLSFATAAGTSTAGNAKQTHDGTGVIVLREIGDAGSPQGRDLASQERFGKILGRSLPFRGQMPDLADLTREIEERWPWAGNLARWIEGQFALIQSAGGEHPRLPNLLLVGPAGCGKTTMLEWLARRCGLHSITVNVGGTADSGGLAAVPRGWHTAQPSLPVRLFLEGECCNPCVVIDEVEKGVGDLANRNGSAAGALLAMTEPSPEGYLDQCLLSKVDLRHVTWMAAANSLAPLPMALRDRFMVQRIPAPGPEHFDIILPGVVADAASKLRIRPEFMPYLSKADREWLKAAFVRSDCSIRGLQQAYGIVSGERARQEARAMQLPN